jgi:putative transposase
VKPSLKYRIIQTCDDRYPVLEMCRFFEVSRSGYYRYLGRKDQPDKDLPLAELIRECQSKRGKIHGYRYVHVWLSRTKQVYHNPKTILRVMEKYDLLSEVRRKKYRPCGQQLHRYANLLNRNFKAEHPNSKWVTDISYIPTQQGFLYLSVIRDLFDNSIIAYKTSRQQTITLVLDTVRSAMGKETVAGELHLHSDQGFQYTSQAYFNLTKEYGITPSMSRRGNPYDNAMAENFFSILKTECIYRQKIPTFEQAQALIDDYIHFYNYERFQLKYRLTPLEKRCQSA